MLDNVNQGNMNIQSMEPRCCLDVIIYTSANYLITVVRLCDREPFLPHTTVIRRKTSKQTLISNPIILRALHNGMTSLNGRLAFNWQALQEISLNSIKYLNYLNNNEFVMLLV